MTRQEYTVKSNRSLIVKHFTNGGSLRSLARHLGMIDDTLSKYLLKYDLDEYIPGYYSKRVTTIIELNRKEILNLRKQGAGINRLARMFGLSNTTIYKLIKKQR